MVSITPEPASATATSAGTFCPAESRRYVLISAVLASSLGFVDSTVVAIAMPAIRGDLGASLADAQWISNAYLLFLSSLVLLGGAAGDVFGVRNIFATGVALFTLTSLACTLVPDAEWLIVMRGVQGVGAGLMVPGSLAIIAKSYPAAERGRAIGLWASASSLTTAAGPLVAAVILSVGSDWVWRLIFAINVPAGALALLLLISKVPRDRPSGGRRLDIFGALLATCGLGLMAWGLTSFGLDAEDRMMPPFVWCVTGAFVFAAFIEWQRRARAPLVRLQLFRSRAFSGANVYTFVLFVAFTAIVFFLPMTVISGWGVKEWQASLMFLPVSLLIASLSRFSGALADRIGPRALLTAGALTVGTAYAGLVATMPMMALWRVTLPIMFIAGLGMAMLVSPLSTAVMIATSDEETGLASGVNNAVARAAGLFSVAALGALAGRVFETYFPTAAAGGDPGFGVAASEHLAPSAAAARLTATNVAFQAVAGVAVLLCLVAALIAWRTQPSWGSGTRTTGKPSLEDPDRSS